MKGQNLSHLFILTLNILSKQYHCLWYNRLSLKNRRIYPTVPTVYGEGYVFGVVFFLLRYRDSSNDSMMSIGIPADSLALRISTSSSIVQQIIT